MGGSMYCLFCKSITAESRSIEHIIPESLGNTEHILPVGFVCDRCNNYFSREVEGPLLDTPYFRHFRYSALIKNKKGYPPRIRGLHIQSLVRVDFFPDMDGSGPSIGAAYLHDETRLTDSLASSNCGTFIALVPTEPCDRLVSRFLAKVAIEALALRCPHHNPELVDSEIVHNKQFDPLHDYARRGSTDLWPFQKRKIYPPDHIFTEPGFEPHTILHEWTFLYTSQLELYFILALFGTEYVLNMGGRDIAGYAAWLLENAQKSPLYPRMQSTSSGDVPIGG